MEVKLIVIFAQAKQNWKGTFVGGKKKIMDCISRLNRVDLGFPSVLVYSGHHSPSLVPTVFNTATVNESFSS